MDISILIQIGYIALSLAALYLGLMLSSLNMGNIHKHKGSIPSFMAGRITLEEYSKGQSYSLKKEHFSMIRRVAGLAFTLSLIFSGFLGWLDGILLSWGLEGFWLGFVFLTALSLLSSLFQLPLQFYSQFVLEEEFGFNRMTPRLYFKDSLKSGILSLVISLPLLFVLYKFLDWAGSWWWIYGWAGFVAFQLLLFFLYPALIAPIFNKFTPLEDGELKESLDDLARNCNFSNQGIFVMDGSKRSSHSNAYFTGMGKFRRIVLFDTLIDQLSTEELKAVLAHEIGHYKKRHITKRMISAMVFSAGAFFLLELLQHWSPLYQAFRMNQPSLHGLLVILMYCSSPLSFFFNPIAAGRSRKQEFEADNFAKDILGSGTELVNALHKLGKKNLSNLTPHPWYSRFYYSHPPLAERSQALIGIEETTEMGQEKANGEVED